MKHLAHFLLQTIVLLLYTCCYGSPNSGFCLPDSVKELTVKFISVRNLIVLPVTINESITVNLILDTGCRNLVLFGKNFADLLQTDPAREIQFSGLGSGKPLKAKLSLNNTVGIGDITGHQLPIIVVSEKNLFTGLKNVQGIIGYDVFLKFEIEINSANRTITFRPGSTAMLPAGFAAIPLAIVDSKPVMSAAKFYGKSTVVEFDLIIDTGSSLGILLMTTQPDVFNPGLPQSVIGQGLNGLMTGYETVLRKMDIDGFEFPTVRIGVIEADDTNHASIGMDILKDYIVIINYCKAYAGFRRVSRV